MEKLLLHTILLSKFSSQTGFKPTHKTNTEDYRSNLSELKYKAITRIAITIAQDATHPLNHHLDILPSGCRYRSLRCRRAHFGKSLLPAAIAAQNKATCWGKSCFHVVLIIIVMCFCVILHEFCL